MTNSRCLWRHVLFFSNMTCICCVGCRSGLMLILSADLLLWLNGVTEDTIHQEIELEKEAQLKLNDTNSSDADGTGSRCEVTLSSSCPTCS